MMFYLKFYLAIYLIFPYSWTTAIAVVNYFGSRGINYIPNHHVVNISCRMKIHRLSAQL